MSRSWTNLFRLTIDSSLVLGSGLTRSLSLFGIANCSVHALPQRDSQVLDEWLDQHASGIYRQNNNFLAFLRQLIPLQPRLAEHSILFHRTKVRDLARIRSGNVRPAGAVVGLPDLPQRQRR